MLGEVVLDNQAGWTEEALMQFRTFEGVLRVDGRALLPSGGFRYAHIFFATEQEAAAFAAAGAAALPGTKRS